MKTPSTDLFQLIKSLSPQEKKYFKQYSRHYSEDRENTYTLLFDAIDAQKKYDEEAIKTKFKDRDFIKQLSVAKNYLYERILDAVVSMNSEADESIYINKLVDRFTILMRKGLMNAALVAYEKAEKKALEVNKLSLLPHITRQRNQILSKIEKRFETSEFIVNGETVLQHSRVLTNALEYELLSIKANVLFGTPTVNTDPAVMKQLDAIMTHPLFENESKALSMWGWYFYSRTKYRYLMLKGMMEEGFELLKNSIEHIKRYPSNSRDWQVTNYRLHCDLLYICFHLRRFKECKRIMTDVQGFIEKKYHPLLAMMQEQFYNRIKYSAQTAEDIEQAIALWEEKQEWWTAEKQNMEVANGIATAFSATKLYFLKGDWKNAIKLLNEINSNKGLWAMHLGGRVYWLMLQYEINNLELLKNQVQSTIEWFKKNNLETPLDKIIFSYFKKLPNAADKDERLKLFTQFKTEMQEIKNNEDADVYFDLLMWVESKISNVAFAEVISNKVQGNTDLH